MGDRVGHRSAFIAAVDHAVGALLVVAGAVALPLGLRHQRLEARCIALVQQVAGPLPAEHVARGVAPRRALVGLVAGEEVEEQARPRDTPFPDLAAAAPIADKLTNR